MCILGMLLKTKILEARLKGCVCVTSIALYLLIGSFNLNENIITVIPRKCTEKSTFRENSLLREKCNIIDPRNCIVSQELVEGKQLVDLSFNELNELVIVHDIALVEEDNDVRDATWHVNRICLRACGMGPSAADMTRMALSICSAPDIMFLAESACPGQVISEMTMCGGVNSSV